MIEPLQKWKRRLLWVLPVLLAVYVLARVTDLVWYRTQRPPDFRDANWSGEWRSAHYSVLFGRLLARLPDPLPENRDFQAEALVYYPVYSIWKTGQFARMEFTGHFSLEARASAGRSTNEIPAGGILKFKGVVGNQVVDYVALMGEDRRVVTGGYLSRSPNDHGSFWIERD